MSKSRSGKNNNFFGRKHTEESLEKMRKSHKGAIPWNTGKKVPQTTGDKNPAKRLEVRKKISESKKGSKNPNWKGGVSTINNRIRHSLEMKLWRESVFQRDNYTCIWCGAVNGNGKNVYLHADHIKPFAFYPELRFAIDNGRTLCKECHSKTNTYGFRKI